MFSRPPARLHVVAVLLALTAALFARALIQIRMRENGLDPKFAADLSYLVVPPILAILLAPVFIANQQLIRAQFSLDRLNKELVFSALAIGVLLRLAWWSHLVAFVSLGIYQSDDPNAIVGPSIVFGCPPAYILATGIIVMAILVPMIEEVVDRGLVQSALYRFGPVVAIAGSAIVFTVYHDPGSWSFTLIAGLVLGTQAYVAKSLWFSLVTHSVFNGLSQIDWRCLQTSWNPTETPLLIPAGISLGLSATSLALIAIVLARMHRGASAPR